jgi:hypothetical protein
MTADPLSTWLGFLTSPTAPKDAMLPMELDGYLTVSLCRPICSFPAAGSMGSGARMSLPSTTSIRCKTVIAAVMDHYNAIIAALDVGFKVSIR